MEGQCRYIPLVKTLVLALVGGCVTYAASTLLSSGHSGAAGAAVSLLVLFLLATVVDVTTATISRSVPDAFAEKLSLGDCGYVLTASQSDSYWFQVKAKHKRFLPLDVLLVVDGHGISLHGPRHILGVIANPFEAIDTRGSHHVSFGNTITELCVPAAARPRLGVESSPMGMGSPR